MVLDSLKRLYIYMPRRRGDVSTGINGSVTRFEVKWKHGLGLGVLNVAWAAKNIWSHPVLVDYTGPDACKFIIEGLDQWYLLSQHL